MRLDKRLLANPRVRAVLCFLAAGYIRLVRLCSRWQMVGEEIPAAFWERREPFIVAFWHGRLLLAAYGWPRHVPFQMLISQHRDGELISRTIGHFGFTSVRGSSRRQGSQALRSMVKALQSGTCIGITPDGPHGPRMRASDGVVSLARLAGVPVIPVAFGISRRRLMGSWDRMIVGLPFSRGVYVWGQPVSVPRDADAEAQEAARLEIEQSLNALSIDADRRCGVTPVAADPA
ncbi:MAG: lysophospholipid acyltransferase family protein [Alphaproteobacteria bacterium]|nr:lysophospholipid acyltransferase family protein [Alphaproteobacteria bacterium]HJP20783.1 lysophospholipid acyltransferase family protein [Alphaproteobacteria bacterium]